MTETPNRSGPFWDGVEGRAPIPRAAATLGFQFIKADVENGTIEVAFETTEDFTNPMGNVLGAFLAAMLYDTVGPALSRPSADQFQSTLDFNVAFCDRPDPVGSSARAVSCTETARLPTSKRPSATRTRSRSPWRPQPPRLSRSLRQNRRLRVEW